VEQAVDKFLGQEI